MFRQQLSGFHRVPFAQACDFDYRDFRTRALICNLSALGAYVHIYNPPPVGSPVALSFRLPDDGTLVLAAARVTWIHDAPAENPTALPLGCGVRFVTVAPEDVRRISALVEAFLKSPHGEAQVGVGLPPSGKVRIPFVAPCVFEGEAGTAQGSVCNVSALGVYAALDRIPEVGERGRITFEVPGMAEPFAALASVAWDNPEYPRRMRALPPGCGMRFEGLTPVHDAVLAALVDGYLSAPQSVKPRTDDGPG